MNYKKIDPSLKLLAKPLIVLLVSVIIIVSLLKLEIPAINNKMSGINEVKVRRSILEQRLSILKGFKAGVLDDHSDVAYTVFPDKNPGALALSQMRQISTEDAIRVLNIEFAQASKFAETLDKTEIKYELEANDINSMLRFLLKLQNTAPISTVDEVSINSDGGAVKATLKSSIYWAALPFGLPPLTEPIKDLTAEEKNLLNKVYSYKLPQFSILAPERQTTERSNPFN